MLFSCEGILSLIPTICIQDIIEYITSQVLYNTCNKISKVNTCNTCNIPKKDSYQSDLLNSPLRKTPSAPGAHSFINIPLSDVRWIPKDSYPLVNLSYPPSLCSMDFCKSQKHPYLQISNNHLIKWAWDNTRSHNWCKSKFIKPSGTYKLRHKYN